METAKEQVEEILKMLPEDASLEDIQYHIYVRQKIEQGLEDVDAGRVVSHAEVQRRLAVLPLSNAHDEILDDRLTDNADAGASGQRSPNG